MVLCSYQHFYDNTGIFNRFIFDRVYDSWILSLILLFTLGVNG